MASYSDFLRVLNRDPLKRFYMLVGPERVLVEEALDSIRRKAAVQQMDYAALSGAAHSSEQVWSEVNQYSLDPARRRLVVLRDAEKLASWEPFEEWALSRSMPNIVWVAVGADEFRVQYLPLTKKCVYGHADFQDVKKGDKQVLICVPCAEVRSRMVKSGMYVDCRLPMDDERREIAAIEIVQSWGSVNRRPAAYLLDRVGWDLGRARDVMRKASYFKGEMSEKVVDALTEKAAADSFVDALISGKKNVALEAAEVVEPEEINAMIGLLDWKLNALAKLNRALRRNLLPREISGATGLKSWSIRELGPYARSYDPVRVRNCTMALAFIDARFSAGDRDGLLEVLCASW